MTLAKHRGSSIAPVRQSDGRILYLDLSEPMSMNYLLAGEICMEQGPTRLARLFLREGEVAIDIGANVGWYSSLFAELVGEKGKVYAFEPNLKALKGLILTGQLYPQLEVIDAALGDEEGETVLHIPSDGGQASTKALPSAVTTQRCKVTTLDAFLRTHESRGPALVKCDAEGAELKVLRGATSFLNSDRPPSWLLEIGIGHAKRFGYHPDQILELFQSIPAGYRAFKVDALTGTLTALEPPIELVRNDAIIVPRWQNDRLAAYLRQIGQDSTLIMPR